MKQFLSSSIATFDDSEVTETVFGGLQILVVNETGVFSQALLLVPQHETKANEF